jgi:hypothetical protein
MAESEREIERMQRTEEAIVVATGAAHERGRPPWVVLGVRVVIGRGVRPRHASVNQRTGNDHSSLVATHRRRAVGRALSKHAVHVVQALRKPFVLASLPGIMHHPDALSQGNARPLVSAPRLPGRPPLPPQIV